MRAAAIHMPRRRAEARRATKTELASLAERLGYLRTTRAGIALLVPLAGAAFPRIRQVSLGALAGTSLLYLGALWAVALGTAAFSAANERELRWQKVDLEQLSRMVDEIDHTTSPLHIPGLFLDRLCDVFGFARGAVLASPEGELRVLAQRGGQSEPAISPGLDPAMQEAWTYGRTILIRELDPETDPRLSALLPGARNVLIVALLVDRDQRLGLAVLERGGNHESIKSWVVTVVEQFASHVALALHNAWLLVEIDQQLQQNRSLQAELQSQNVALETTVEARTQQLRDSLQELRLVNEQPRRLLARP